MAQYASLGASLATHCTACLGSSQPSVPFVMTGNAESVIAPDRQICTHPCMLSKCSNQSTSLDSWACCADLVLSRNHKFLADHTLKIISGAASSIETVRAQAAL